MPYTRINGRQSRTVQEISKMYIFIVTLLTIYLVGRKITYGSIMYPSFFLYPVQKPGSMGFLYSNIRNDNPVRTSFSPVVHMQFNVSHIKKYIETYNYYLLPIVRSKFDLKKDLEIQNKRNISYKSPDGGRTAMAPGFAVR